LRLIATLGTTPAKFKHSYAVNGQTYQSRFSFEALKAHYNITDKDVVIVGTKETKKKQEEFIGKYRFEEVDSNDLEAIFSMMTAILQSGDIIKPKKIYYAQVNDSSKLPTKESCDFHFVELEKYDEIADLARVINTFVSTLFVLDISTFHDSFKIIYRYIDQLSHALFDNNHKKAFEIAAKCKDAVEKAKETKLLQEHLKRLEEELNLLLSLDKDKESERLLAISEYFNEKEITLHAITTLYESMVAFLDEEIGSEKCNEKTTRSGKKRQADSYERRNCLKKEMKNHTVSK